MNLELFSSSYMGREEQKSVLLPSFRDALTGENAFYLSPNYVESTRRDLLTDAPLPTLYTSNTEHKIVRIAKTILSILIFPIGIYYLLHSLIGKIALLPASSPTLMGYSENHANRSRSEISLTGQWKYKRFTHDIDGNKIDCMIVGKASTLGNGRWVLASNGNGQFYEDLLSHRYNFKHLLSELDSNALVFNYTGVGTSSGWPNNHAMIKTYHSMLTLLEDQEKGIGAREIIGYGYSIGGGVQGEALKAHPLKEGIKYVFVKDMTFSNLVITASLLTNRLLGAMVGIFGWNMDTATSSKKLQMPEIIMQAAKVEEYEELTDSSKIIGDGIIPAKASLAKALLDDKQCLKDNKLFIGVPNRHNEGLRDPTYLAKKIEFYLSSLRIS